MFVIGDYRVKVVTGRKSQTVNIGRASLGHGEHEWVIRMRAPDFASESDLTQRGFMSVEALVRHLQERYRGDVERSPGSSGPPRLSVSTATIVEPTAGGDRDDPWTRRAVVLVEHAIDQLVIEFAELPYLHRVEHSLHCELYSLLTSNRMLGRPYPLARGAGQSQLVHKEWPEPVARPEKGNRRGNVDLVVLHPHRLAEAALEQFQEGRIRPIIAVEIGLNYPLTHLSDDVAKLTNSGVEHSYVVHLVRDARYPLEETQRFVAASPMSSAVAWVGGDRAWVKLVGDTGTASQ